MVDAANNYNSFVTESFRGFAGRLREELGPNTILKSAAAYISYQERVSDNGWHQREVTSKYNNDWQAYDQIPEDQAAFITWWTEGLRQGIEQAKAE
jgi:hypothetical protein